MISGTINELDKLVQNPPPGFQSVFNGRSAYDRLKDAHKQATARMRRKQIERYDVVRTGAQELLDEDVESAHEVLRAVQALRKDLKRGLADPRDVMHKV